MRRFRVLILALLLMAPAAEARAQTVADIEVAWRGWMNRNGRTTGSLAVLHQGRVAHEAATGRDGIGQPLPMASLSKAVTGVCIAGLIDQGRLAFDTPLSQALQRTIARVGTPVDPRLLGVTVAQLLTHRAGFDPGRNHDPATAPLYVYLAKATATRTAFDEGVKWIFGNKLPLPPGARYVYSNAAYLLLGAIIQETTGQDYETYCKTTVLTPLGARGAALDPAWRILSSYGGWRMSLADYGRFYQAFAEGNPAIGPVARRWMMSPEGKQIGGGSGVHHGLGTFVRPTAEGGGNFWHWGGWSYDLRPAFDGPLHASYSTFAVRWGALDVNVVVHMEPTLAGEGGAGNQLNGALGAAARKVTRWP